MQPDRWKKIDFNLVVYIETSRWNTLFYLENGDIEKCNYSMLKVQSFLPPGFERIHRSVMVNVSFIEDINSSFTVIKLRNKTILNVGNSYKANLRKYLMEMRKIGI